MADNNKVKLDVELEVKRGALDKATRELNDWSARHERFAERRRQAQQQGGRHSSGFLISDRDVKESLKHVQTAKTAFLKAEQDLENRSRPGMKRVAGFFHKLMYGEKVQSGEDADKEHRKMDMRMSTFQRKLHGTLALSTHLAGTLAPLPGGGALHAGVAGFAGGFAEGSIDPETGQQKKGMRGAAGALWGGLKGGAAAAGLMLLAKGVSGAVQGGREDESLRKQLGRAGGLGLLSGGLGLARSGQFGMKATEAAPIIAQTFRGGGGVGAARGALRAQAGMGLGAEFNQLQSGLSRVGIEGGQRALDANAKKMWADVMAAGYDKAIKRINPRLVTEGLAGAMAMVSKTTLGGRMGEVGEVFKAQRFLEPKFGGRAFEVMGKLEDMAKGQTSPLARGVGLMAGGIGQGKSFVQANLEMEKGFFGQKGKLDDKGVEALKNRVRKIADLFGGVESENAVMGLQAAMGAGTSMTEAKGILDLVKTGGGAEDFEKIKKAAMTQEEKAFEAMSHMDWDAIDKRLEHIQKLLADIFKALGGFTALKSVLDSTLAVLQGIAEVLGVAKKEGVGAAVSTTFNKLTGNDYTGGQMLPEGWRAGFAGKSNPEGMFRHSRMGRGLNPAADAEARRMMETAAPRSEVRKNVYQDRDRTLHFVLDLVDQDSGKVLQRKEAVMVEGSGTPQFKVVTP